MKICKVLGLVFLLTAAAAAQTVPATESLGLNAFANTNGPILVAIDAALAVRQLDQPYLMFVLYLGAKKNGQEIHVRRDGIVVSFKGQDFGLPSVKEFHAAYAGQIKDLDMYAHLGKEGLASSWIRVYSFADKVDFFPPLTLGAPLPADEATLYNLVGFHTIIYLKNPGFKKGDAFKLKVRDAKDPGVTGEVDVVL